MFSTNRHIENLQNIIGNIVSFIDYIVGRLQDDPILNYNRTDTDLNIVKGLITTSEAWLINLIQTLYLQSNPHTTRFLIPPSPKESFVASYLIYSALNMRLTVQGLKRKALVVVAEFTIFCYFLIVYNVRKVYNHLSSFTFYLVIVLEQRVDGAFKLLTCAIEKAQLKQAFVSAERKAKDQILYLIISLKDKLPFSSCINSCFYVVKALLWGLCPCS